MPPHILPRIIQTAGLTILAVGLPLLVTESSLSQSMESARPKEMSIPDVVASVRPSVVTVLTRGVPLNPFQHPSPPGSGSGLIIDEHGFILTNNHLVEGIKSLVVGLPNGKLTPGRVIGRDFLLDLALIKIEAKDLVAARLGRSSTLQIGETVVAIGNPFALKGGSTVTAGVVSALDRSILAPNGETLYDLIQTDAAINPGNSGGPLVDRSGLVVGISVAVAPSAQAISYAISIDAAYPNIQSLLVRGSVLRPELGFVPVTVTPSIVAGFNLDLDRGVLVVQVESSKAAAQAGLQAGDVITAVDNTPLYNVADFWHVFLRPAEQAVAQLTVYGKNGQFSASLPRTPVPRATR
ncbi:MAG TPA: trypsin-like peptidase domain-containing protein [Nitrospiraceae bacterium]|nr:trypsin-like peptidase domain-containing protein [Nitrospiraceae bacterium]